MVADLREEIFKKLINQSMRFFGNMDVGHLISRCTNAVSYTHLATGGYLCATAPSYRSLIVNQAA